MSRFLRLPTFLRAKVRAPFARAMTALNKHDAGSTLGLMEGLPLFRTYWDHEPARSAGFPACGFTGHSCPVFLLRATGKSPEPADRNVCPTHPRFIERLSSLLFLPPEPGFIAVEGRDLECCKSAERPQRCVCPRRPTDTPEPRCVADKAGCLGRSQRCRRSSCSPTPTALWRPGWCADD